MPQYDRKTSITKNYNFDIDHAGIIIGKKGSGINSLREIPGVVSINLDTESSSKTCFLEVQATDVSVCEKVFSKIQRKISRTIDQSRRAIFSEIFIETKENENEIQVKTYDQQSNMPILFEKDNVNSVYMFHCFSNARLEPSSPYSYITSKTEISYKNFSRDAVKKAFENSLSSIDFSTVANLEFNVSPGKTVFIGTGGSNLKKIYLPKTGCAKVDGLKPVYVTFLNPSLRDNLLGILKTNGFATSNEDAREAFTTVHFYVGKEKAIFSAELAHDENVKEFNDEKSDKRYSEDKKKAIERVFQARTVGEVLTGTGSLILIYHRLTMLLHPDKNSHPGAKKAFKKLRHAFETISEEKSKDAPALEIKNLGTESSKKPPKVLRVKADKTKICTVTTFSGATLDLRASLVRYADDLYGLSQHVINALNECWEKRDSEGGMSLPDEKTYIYIKCIKQVIARHIWVKEIAMSRGTYLFKVDVKEIRKITDKQKNYENCLEVDMKIIADRRKWSAEELAEEFLKIKEEWEKICFKIQCFQ